MNMYSLLDYACKLSNSSCKQFVKVIAICEHTNENINFNNTFEHKVDFRDDEKNL